MRIGIDCRLSGNAHAGIGRYIENLIVRLPQLSSDITWVLFFSEKKQIPFFNGKPSNVEIHLTPIRHYSLAEQLQLPSFFKNAHLDLLHVPHFNIPLLYKGKLLITIHDLLWHEYKGAQVTTLNPLLYWIKYAAYRYVASQAIKRAARILVPATTVKKTLTRYFPNVRSKITVTNEGVSGEFKSTAKLGLPPTVSGKQLVYVGSLYPHKNIDVVLGALTQLNDWHLHLVGSRNVFRDQISAKVKELNLEKKVTFHGYLNDAKLTALLHRSTALVQPSLSEGFGLTGIEAMAAGIPVIASDIPVFKEIYREGALFFDPHNSNSLSKVLNQLDNATITEQVKRGQKVSSYYSWDKMAKETFDTYLQLLHA